MYDDPDSYFMNADRPRGRSREPEEPPILPQRKPPRVISDLSEVNMDNELATQLAEATSFRDYVLENSAMFQPNHVTDTIKTCNTLLGQIIKMQESVQTMQRMKAFEDAVITVMKTQPENVKTEFFTLLEQELK